MSAYGAWLADALDTAVTGGTVKAMLVDATFVFDPDDTTVDDSAEITGTGYTAGGEDVTSLVSIDYDSTNDRVAMTLSADVNFGTITADGIAAVIFYVVGGFPLVVDVFGATDADGSDDFVYTRGADGVLVIPVAT